MKDQDWRRQLVCTFDSLLLSLPNHLYWTERIVYSCPCIVYSQNHHRLVSLTATGQRKFSFLSLRTFLFLFPRQFQLISLLSSIDSYWIYSTRFPVVWIIFPSSAICRSRSSIPSMFRKESNEVSLCDSRERNTRSSRWYVPSLFFLRGTPVEIGELIRRMWNRIRCFLSTLFARSGE